MDAQRARQYLKAMGITAWVPRAAERAAERAADAAADGTTDSAPLSHASHMVPESAGSVAIPAACDTPVAAYLEQIASCSVEPLQSASGQLLVVVEPPDLSQTELGLLHKMLVAIDLDPASQGIVSLSGSGVVSLPNLIAQAQPKLLLIMAGCGDTPGSLDSYRAQIHYPDWCSAGVVVSHHPGDLNRQAELKRPAWEDLKRARAQLDARPA